jgi:hypothetical protein
MRLRQHRSTNRWSRIDRMTSTARRKKKRIIQRRRCPRRSQ